MSASLPKVAIERSFQVMKSGVALDALLTSRFEKGLAVGKVRSERE